MPALNRYYFGLFEYIKHFFAVPEGAAIVQMEKINPTHYDVVRDSNGDLYKYEITIQEFYDARNSVRLYAGYCKALNTLYYSFNVNR